MKFIAVAALYYEGVQNTSLYFCMVFLRDFTRIVRNPLPMLMNFVRMLRKHGKNAIIGLHTETFQTDPCLRYKGCALSHLVSIFCSRPSLHLSTAVAVITYNDETTRDDVILHTSCLSSVIVACSKRFPVYDTTAVPSTRAMHNARVVHSGVSHSPLLRVVKFEPGSDPSATKTHRDDRTIVADYNVDLSLRYLSSRTSASGTLPRNISKEYTLIS